MTFEEEMRQNKQELIKELESINSRKAFEKSLISKCDDDIKRLEKERSVLNMKLDWLSNRGEITKEVKEKLIENKCEIQRLKSEIRQHDLYLHDLYYRPAHLEGEIKRLENLGF